ncbi:P-loop containing nucleoside triphosphate hydrolase protein [Apiospora rasikravindrae]|uniref:Kinesin-like protein n=1 Tax=Apiospora rasikravindrae TaxID=990691 RepID=A0ABR1UAD8_9PEZI
MSGRPSSGSSSPERGGRQPPCAQVVQTAQDEVNRLAKINSITTMTAEVLTALCDYLKSGMAEGHGARGISQQELEHLFRAFNDKMAICSKQHDITTHLEICKNMQSQCEGSLLNLIKLQEAAITEQKDREQEKERCKQIEWEKFHKNINAKFAEQMALIKGGAVGGMGTGMDDDGMDVGLLRKKASMVDVMRNEKATMQQVLDESEAAIATLTRETETKTAEIRALQVEMQRLSQGEGNPANKKLMETQKSLIEANKRADQAERARREKADEAEDLRQEIADLQGSTRQQLAALQSKVEGAETRESALQEDYREVEKRLGQCNEANAKLYEELCDLKGNLRVMTRVRPALGEPAEDVEDIDMAPGDLVDQLQWVGLPDPNHQSMRSKQNGEAPPTQWHGQFECVFDKGATNADIFDEVKPVLGSAFNGKNATVFAYGQSGSGKTYTLGTAAVAADLEEGGLIPRSIDMLRGIYAEKVYDLLTGRKNEVKTGQVKVPGKSTSQFHADCSSETVTSDGMLDVDRLQSVLSEAAKHRSTGSTAKNSQSSRSHSVLTLRIYGTHRYERGHDGSPRMTEGVLNLIDLAGSEKFGVSGDKVRQEEGIMINKSLLALRQVIEGMADPKIKVIPFRESMLTRLLEPCLGDGSKVIMLTMLSPLKGDREETRSTLNFAKIATNARMQTIKAANNLGGSSSSSSQAPRTPANRGTGLPVSSSRTGAGASKPSATSSRPTPPLTTTPRTPSQQRSGLRSAGGSAAARFQEDSQGKQTLPPRTSATRPLPTHVSFRERVANAQNSYSSDEEVAPAAPPKAPRTPAASSSSSSSSSSAAAGGGIPRATPKLSRSNAVRRPSVASSSQKESPRRH